MRAGVIFDAQEPPETVVQHSVAVTNPPPQLPQKRIH